MKITVYKLVASDYPLQVRYVGITMQTLSKRLAGHFGEINSEPWKKDRRRFIWLDDVIGRGARVEILPLSEHDTAGEAQDAERRWILFWEKFCDLLNVAGTRGRTYIRCGGKAKTSH